MLQKITTLTISALFIFAGFSLANDSEDENLRTIEWEIDRPHSAINFTVRHFFTPVNGIFEDYEATVLFNPEDLNGSRIDVTIPVSSVNTRNDRRDGHLQSEDFFNVEQWPNISFTSHTIESRGDNQYVAIGEITIRDVTREFELPFTLLGIMDHPMRENTQIAGITANAELLRTDFGVGVGDWAATVVVGDKVNIQLNLELTSSL